jgi:23S rRNA (pseudouridine1915-N3)-methyltransferase
LRQVPDNARLLALDAGGEMLTSEAFATLLRRLADGGQRELAFAIGGADGLAEPVRARAASSLSFGPMVWPHMLARVMLTEQLYRAAAILAGSPYHRG